MEQRFFRATEMAHFLVRARVRPGDTVVDATLGTGADLVFLSGCVGSEGRVVGFDVQDVAVERACTRFGESGAGCDADLHVAGHERMAEYVSAPVSAVMFNLGYLPGGDKTLITRPETTLAALEAALVLLQAGGVVTVVCYRGHEGGAEEAELLVEWSSKLDQRQFAVLRYGFLNQRNAPPFLVAIERR